MIAFDVLHRAWSILVYYGFAALGFLAFLAVAAPFARARNRRLMARYDAQVAARETHSAARLVDARDWRG